MVSPELAGVPGTGVLVSPELASNRARFDCRGRRTRSGRDAVIFLAVMRIMRETGENQGQAVQENSSSGGNRPQGGIS